MRIADREEGCTVEDVWISGYWEMCLEEVGLGKNGVRRGMGIQSWWRMGMGKGKKKMR